MNTEMLQLKARLAENKNKYAMLEIDKLELIKSIKQKADAYEEDPTKIKTEEIIYLAQKLDTTVKEMIKTKNVIEQMIKDLGV